MPTPPKQTAPTSPDPGPPRRRRRVWPFLVPALLPPVFVGAYALGLFLTRNASSFAQPSHIPMLLLLCAICLGVSIGVIVHDHLHWKRPARRLQETLHQIRNNELTIDHLYNASGELRPLAEEIVLLLHDLKMQRAQINSLQLEMSQRVARRTNAMERTIHALQHQAVHDPLTGLFNRRMLDEYLPKILEDSKQREEMVCILAINVDDFKLLNDTVGHAPGDRLLASLGQLIRSSIRGNDAGFRCGGDGFVIVLPGCTRAKGQAIAERLTRLVDELGRTLHVSRAPHLSIGIATTEGGLYVAKAILQKADDLTYEVKRARKATLRIPPRAA
jgi:diguanylate cyclase (GGDEF)-like protein